VWPIPSLLLNHLKRSDKFDELDDLKNGRLALPKDCPSQINNLLWLESKIENALGVLRIADNGKKQHGQLLGPFHEEISIRMGMHIGFFQCGRSSN
jgi:hypothetical protein